jgi:RNA polymerase sigma factor (sigma-70 family)
MLYNSEWHSDAYRVWTDQHALMSGSEEKKELSLHEEYYAQLVFELPEDSRTWFASKYVEINLEGDDWRDHLWTKRPFGRHVIEIWSTYLDDHPDAPIKQIYQGWLDVREYILARNVRLVLKVAHQHNNEYLELMDLVQEGQFGLMRALERFECAQGWRFSTYATQWIVQFIRLSIKKNNRTVSVPTNVQERLQRYRKAVVQSQQLAGRKTTHAEVASLTETNSSDVADTLALGLPVYSLNAAWSDDNDDNGRPIDRVEANYGAPEFDVEQGQRKTQVKQLLSSLSSRDRMVLEMRYGIGMPQAYGYREIADQLRLSRERVRQIEIEVIKRLGEQSGERLA